MNLLGTNSENDYKFRVSIRISIVTTDMWKSIHKTALTRDQIKIGNEPNNHPDFYFSNATTKLLEELIPEVIADLIPKSANPCTLNILPLNSDSKTVYDYIHLLLSLNQLQCLIVEGIMDHAIKFKGKMYLDSGEQLLIYIRDEGGVGKSKVVKAIEMGFILLNRRKELLISTPTNFAANGISRSIVHRVLEVNN